MNDVLLDDIFHPKFVHFSRVSDAELDPFRRLPNAALTDHIDAAIEAWDPTAATPGDLAIEYLEPVIGAQNLRIDIWVESLGDACCTYGFLCSSENGNLAYARGERTLVKTDPRRSAALVKNLPALV